AGSAFGSGRWPSGCGPVRDGWSLMAEAFLLPAGLPATTVAQVAVLALDAAELTGDRVKFGEGGGDVDVELSVPFRPGMDEVVVNDAHLVLRAEDTSLAITRWHTAPGPGDVGVFVVLDT